MRRLYCGFMAFQVRIHTDEVSYYSCMLTMCSYLVAEITPVGFASIHWKYFFLYMCTNATAGVTVYFFCKPALVLVIDAMLT